MFFDKGLRQNKTRLNKMKIMDSTDRSFTNVIPIFRIHSYNMIQHFDYLRPYLFFFYFSRGMDTVLEEAAVNKFASLLKRCLL